jgi:hypothetical protein
VEYRVELHLCAVSRTITRYAYSCAHSTTIAHILIRNVARQPSDLPPHINFSKMVEFPYEIFYLIIEEVEDKLTLKSCALVCRSFVEPSQKNIFRVIDLGDRCITGEVYYRRFYRLISTHPHIANYVRDFRLVDSYVWDRKSDWQWLVKEPTLPLTFQLLPRLQAFSLIFTTGAPAWNSFASHVQAAIFKLLTRRTISSLSLRRIHGVPASLLVQFTRIKHLELYEVEMDPSKASFKDDPSYQPDLHPELRSLTLKSPSSSVVKAIFELLSFSCPSTLENFSIISANEKDDVLRNDLWRLIEWMGSSISRLWWRPRTHPKFPALGNELFNNIFIVVDIFYSEQVPYLQ